MRTLQRPAEGFDRLYLALRWAFLLAVLAYLFLFGLNSLTRQRRFSPDSMNYVDVARNIADGRGIVQSTLGFNRPHWDPHGTIPTPITSQPPVYPLLIALFSLFGLSYADAALLIPVLCYGAILFLSYLLALELYGEHIALTAVACLSIYFPLRYVSSFAWSEPTAMAFALLSFGLLARTRYTLAQRIWVPLAAGLAAGLAFATRYAFLPLFFLGILLLIEPQDRRWTARNLALYMAGFGLLGSWVIGRSLLYEGTLLGPSRNPSLLNLGDNWRDMVDATFKGYLDPALSNRQYTCLWLSLLAMGVVLLLQHRLGAVLEEVFLRGKAYLLTFWSIGYLAFLIYQRTLTHFDAIGPRLIVPAGAALAMLWSALLVKTTGLKVRHLIYPALLLAFWAIRGEAQTLAEAPPRSETQAVAQSERLSWVAQWTTDRDLIVGDDTMDIPFYFGRTGAVSFSPYPYTDYMDYDRLVAFVRAHCGEYEHIYLLLRDRYGPEEAWRRACGPFIADLAFGRTAPYPDIVYRRRLSDGFVFEVQCPPG